MSEKNDDSIEEFFRKAVRQSDTTFRETDWTSMEKLLNEQAAVRAAARATSVKRIAGGVTGAVLVMLGVYLFVYNGKDIGKGGETQQAAAGKGALDMEKRSPAASLLLKEEENSTAQKQNDQETKSSATSSIAEKGSETEQPLAHAEGADETFSNPTSEESRETTGTKTTIAKNAPSKKGTSSVTDDTSTAKKATPIVASGVHNNKNTSRQKSEEVIPPTMALTKEKVEATAIAPEATNKSDVRNSEGEESKSISTETQIAKKETSAEEKKNTGTIVTRNQDAQDTETKKDSIKAPVPIEEVALKDVAATEEKKEQKEENAFASRWNAAVVVAPDFSSTSFGKMTSPGGAFGLMIGYRVLKRFTITSGVLKTSKKYEGYGSDYHPPYGYWYYKTNGVVPDRIYGQCSVIEIPVLIQYDIKQSTQSRIYLSGGLSSYRMLSESYTYTFETPNPGADDSWSSDKPSSYAFSIGHISAGYERRLFHGLSLGVEPYVKIPFKGIGWSSVNLFTTGLYVNARYRF